LQKDSNRDWDDPSIDHFIDRWTGIQNGRNATKYQSLLNKIRKDIDWIYTFVQDKDESVSQIQESKAPAAAMTYWLDIQTHTRRLQEKLFNIWSHTCSSPQHQAKIRLGVDIDEQAASDQVLSIFNYSFLLDQHVTSTIAEGGMWRDVVVASQSDNIPLNQSPGPKDDANRLRPSLLRSTERPGTQSDMAKTKHKGKKKATFTIPGEEFTGPSDGKQTPTPLCGSEKHIHSLCEALKRDVQKDCCLGLLSCGDASYHIHDAGCQSRDLVPVRSIIGNGNNAYMIPPRQR